MRRYLFNDIIKKTHCTLNEFLFKKIKIVFNYLKEEEREKA